MYRALFTLSLLLATAGHAAGVLVVRSQDLPPYLAVQEGFSAALGRPVSALSLAREGAPGLARALAERPELVLAVGLEAARAVSERAPGVPLVCALVPSPEAVGAPAAAVVPMFASPERQLRALRAAVPAVRRVGLFYPGGSPPARNDPYARAARALGLEVEWAEVPRPADLPGVARQLAGRVDALLLTPDASLVTPQSFRFLVELSFERKLPLVGFSQVMVKAGALVASEPSYADMARGAAQVGRRLLAGAPAGTPPAADALYLNARSAVLLGVTLPPEARAQAAHVFE